MTAGKRPFLPHERKAIVDHCSMWELDEAAFSALLPQGDLNFVAQDPAGRYTPLRLALFHGNWTAACALLESGASPFLKDRRDLACPFRIALSGLQVNLSDRNTSSDQLLAFKLLSEAGARLEILPEGALDANGRILCPYERALVGGRPRRDADGGFSAWDALISVGLDASSFNGRALTPLMLAARAGDDPFALFLLSRGADQSLISEEGDSALSLALETERFSLALALLESPPRSVLEHRAYPGRGPLAIACSASHQGSIACDQRRLAVERLADLGQSFHERDRMNRSPLDILRERPDRSFQRLAEWAELFEIARAPLSARKPPLAL